MGFLYVATLPLSIGIGSTWEWTRKDKKMFGRGCSMVLQIQAEKKRRNRRRLSLVKETYRKCTGRPNTEDRFAGLVFSALRKRRHLQQHQTPP